MIPDVCVARDGPPRPGVVNSYDIRKACRTADQLLAPVACISLSNDGNCLLASCLDSSLHLVEAATGEHMMTYKGASIVCLRPIHPRIQHAHTCTHTQAHARMHTHTHLAIVRLSLCCGSAIARCSTCHVCTYAPTHPTAHPSNECGVSWWYLTFCCCVSQVTRRAASASGAASPGRTSSCTAAPKTPGCTSPVG
jgi:hypothetical protein